MLRFSKEQFQALSLIGQEDFLKRTTSHLLDRFSAEIAGQGLLGSQMEEFVRRGIREARLFAVVHEEDVRLYVECMLVVHPGFAWSREEPSWGDILQREDLSGTEKMDRIHDQLVLGWCQDGVT